VNLTCSVVAVVVLAGWAAGISQGQEKITYNRDVRPILSNNCFLCHGRDEKNRMAKLRLDVRESATKPRKSDSAAIVPGKPDDSALVRRIFAEDETEIMPPPQSHKKLSAREKQILKRWIAEGAEYQDHWAYISPTRPHLPRVQRQDLVRNPIDPSSLPSLRPGRLHPRQKPTSTHWSGGSPWTWLVCLSLHPVSTQPCFLGFQTVVINALAVHQRPAPAMLERWTGVANHINSLLSVLTTGGGWFRAPYHRLLGGVAPTLRRNANQLDDAHHPG
jgi:hypothetical protein